MRGREKVPRGALLALRGVQPSIYYNSGMYAPATWASGVCHNDIIDGALNTQDLAYLTQTWETADITSVYEFICYDSQLIQNLSGAPIRVQIFPFFARDYTQTTAGTMLTDFVSSTTWGVDWNFSGGAPNPITAGNEIWLWPQISPFQVPYWWRKYALSPRKPVTFMIPPFGVKSFRRKKRCLLARENLQLLKSSANGMLPYISERMMIRASGILCDTKESRSDTSTTYAIDLAPGAYQIRWLNKYVFRRVVQEQKTIIGSVAPFIAGSSTVYSAATAPTTAFYTNKLGLGQEMYSGSAVSYPGASGNANIAKQALAVNTAGPATNWDFN